MKIEIKIDEKCMGCLSFARVPDYYKAECKFTDGGITSILNCPCKECLIKGVCINPCENFITKANKYKRTNKWLMVNFPEKKVKDELLAQLINRKGNE